MDEITLTPITYKKSEEEIKDIKSDEEIEKIIKESDNFWIEDITVLFKLKRLVEFFPSRDMSDEEKLNSLVRFSIYFSIIVSLYKKEIKLMIFPIIIMLFTLFVYKKSSKIPDLKEKFLEEK